MDYAQYKIDIAELMPTELTDPDFETILPLAIAYAENRLYADLDLLATRIRNASESLTPNSRNFTLPTDLGTFVVVEGINIFLPAGSTATTGQRNQLLPSSKEFIDAAWPQEQAISSPSIPEYMAPITDQLWIVGPPPDLSYLTEIIGTMRPTPLSEDNPTTPLTVLVPHLFVVATMVFMSGYMRDFSPMSDEPQMPVTWEQQYKKLLTTALTEEFRKKYQSMAWTNRLPDPIATPPQT